MRFALALVIVIAGGACKKTSEDPPPPPRAPVAPARPPLPPLRPAQPGAAFVSLENGDVLRFDQDGWKKLGTPKQNTALSFAIGPDGTVRGYNGTDVYRVEGDKLIHTEAPATVWVAAGGSDGSLWALFEGTLKHLVGETWTVEEIPGGDPPRSIAPAPEGVWVNTLDRTFRKDGATWKPFDVPGVTGQAVDIFHIASNGRGGVYLSATNGIHAFDGTAWKAVTMPRDLKIGYAAAVVPGPGGRFAYATAENQVYFGDTSSGLHPLDAKSAGVETYRLAPEEIDDRGRIWATDGAGVIVFDTAGKVVRHWRPEEVPVFTSKPIRIAVHLGGPAQLQSGERATATITGKIEGSAPGLKLVACAQATPEYDKEPCQGIATARRATTSAGGRFTLEGVPLGPLNFWVQRGGRWRPMKGTACCADVPPDGTFEVGTLAYAQ